MPNNSFRSKKVVISGYYGFDNFGDEAILHVLVRELKKLVDNVEIVVLSKNPKKTSSELKVKSVNRMNFIKVLSEISSCQMLISGGGSLLQDVTSPLTIFYYLLIIFMAQILNKKTFIYAQGIGPINRPISLKATKYILNKATYITVRDSKSLDFLSSLNIKAELTSDPVWLGLSGDEAPGSLLADFKIDDSTNVIGINLRPWAGVGMLELQDLAIGVNNIAAHTSSVILIMPFQFNQDINICTNFYNLLTTINPKLKVFLIEKNYSPMHWDKIVNACNQLIGMRFHAIICALIHNIEVFGLSYDPKVETLLNLVDAHYVDIKDWREKKLINSLQNWQDKFKNGPTYKSDFNQNIALARQNLIKLVKILQDEPI